MHTVQPAIPVCLGLGGLLGHGTFDSEPAKPQANQDSGVTLGPGLFTRLSLLSMTLSTLERQPPALEIHQPTLWLDTVSR